MVLDVGTTTQQVAYALSGRRNLTVITPSLRIANVLSRNTDIRLMMTGGIVVPSELSLVGDAAEEGFARLRFDTYVMGVGGINVDAGVTEYSLEDARVKRAALAGVRRCIVVADSSKLGTVTFAQVCPLERVDVVVTDSAAAKEDIEALESEHVEVVDRLMGRITDLFGDRKPLIAMAHLRPLPGTPLYDEREGVAGIVAHGGQTSRSSWRPISTPYSSATKVTCRTPSTQTTWALPP